MKYTVTVETKSLGDGRTVRRIRRTDGTLGGFIESPQNLSQTGSCWLHGDSIASGESRVREDAQIHGMVSDEAIIRGRAEIYGIAHERAIVRGDVKVYGTVGGSQVYEGDQVLYGIHP
ncbi:hypothetical protein LCM19_08830 [Qipengyuania flava]|nr:hypothetical protein [Qipengyuania flava]